MIQHKLHCSLITPEAKVFEDEVDFVCLPAHDGEIGFLVNRAPLVCQLGAGRMKIRQDRQEQSWFIDAGFAQVVDNRVVILTQKAIRSDEINKDEAVHQLEDARKMPASDDDAIRKRSRAEASARAKLRMS
jgi:F-type H+-transporting ATPase subunit epsilon